MVSLLVFCTVSFWGLFSIRERMQKSSEDLGDFAVANSSRFLEAEVLDKLMAEARDQSLIINERLLGIAKDALFLSNFISEIYKYGSQLPAVSIPYSSTANNGKLVVQLKSANGKADYARIRREAELLGNVKALFESINEDMIDMIIGIFAGTESGFHISYDKYSHDRNQVLDPRLRPWYIGAKRDGKLSWTVPYIGVSSGELVITCSRPFTNANGEFMGVLGIDVLIAHLNSEIVNVRTSDGGFTFIVDSDGTLISSSIPGITEMPSSILNDVKKAITPGARGFRRVLSGETEMLLVYAPIQTTGWSFVIVEPASIKMEIVTDNRNAINVMTTETITHANSIMRFTILVFILIFAIVVVAIAVFSGKFSAKIAQPIDTLEAELNVATRIQASMLPNVFPAFPYRTEFDIHANMLAAKEVGGDFYDFFMVDANTLAVVIADVSGKGVPAALFMVIAKTLIKNNALSGKSPQEVFYSVNNLLCENNEAGMFVTVFMGYLDIYTGKFTYVNAGHNPPLLKRAGKNFEWLSVIPGFVLAGLEDIQYKQYEITMNKDDLLFLYTDGASETFNNKGELFTESRLIESVNKNNDTELKDFLQDIKNDIDIFAKGAEQADDITMLALKYKGSDKMANELENKLTVDAHVVNLEYVLSFLSKEMVIKNIPEAIQNNINIAAEEIFVNIAKYAYTGSTGNVTVKIDIDSEIVIEFNDSGVKYNPLEKDDPAIDAPIEEREVGGLGIFMVKKLMDTVEYKYENGNNIFIMKKKVT